MGEIDDVSKDMVLGMDAMASFTGIKKQKLYYLASTNQLPGAFRFGRNWALLKSVYVADIRSRATKGTGAEARA